MTEFQELQIKHNFHLVNMICTLHSENVLIMDMLGYQDKQIEHIKNISNEFRDRILEEYHEMKKDLEQYYKDKAGE